MKSFSVVAGIMLAIGSAWGQTTPAGASDNRPCLSNAVTYCTANMTQVKKNFLWSLDSENDGVVESSLAHVAQMRILLPREDLRSIEDAVNRLTTNGRTPVVRYKAYLASQAFVNPGLFSAVASTSYESSDDFFTALGTRLQQSMLGYTSK